MTAERDSIAAVVTEREHEQANLRRERDTRAAEAQRLRDSVTALERSHADAQLTVAVDSLALLVAALQDSIAWLEAAQGAAWAAGFEAAHAGYQDLSQRYVAEVRRPRFSLTSALGVVAAAGVGFVLGSVLHE